MDANIPLEVIAQRQSVVPYSQFANLHVLATLNDCSSSKEKLIQTLEEGFATVLFDVQGLIQWFRRLAKKGKAV